MSEDHGSSAQEADTHRATADSTGQGHTPGPWHENDGEIGSDLGLVCQVYWSSGQQPGESEANARLIAAAPMLLAFANALDASWTAAFPEGPDGPCEVATTGGHLAAEHRKLWQQCRAAIAEVAGEAGQ